MIVREEDAVIRGRPMEEDAACGRRVPVTEDIIIKDC